MVPYDAVILLIKALVIGFVIFAVLVYVLRPLWQGLSASSPPRNEFPKRLSVSRRETESEVEIPTNDQAASISQKAIEMARENPNKTAQLVRNWIHEKKPH